MEYSTSHDITGEQNRSQTRPFTRHAASAEGHSPDLFIVGAALSVGASLVLRILGHREDAHFVAQWAPTLLIAGLYTRGESRILKALRRQNAEATPPTDQIM